MNNSQSRTQTKMFIYNLPIDINRQLCRLLDHDDKWKDLAGYHMKFDPFEIMVSLFITFKYGVFLRADFSFTYFGLPNCV